MDLRSTEDGALTRQQYLERHVEIVAPSVKDVRENVAESDHSRRNQLDPRVSELSNCLGVDPDLFFPERGASTREAKEVCRGCVVVDECLEFALTNGEKHGIWGGMSERERRRIRRQRALARNAIADPPQSPDSA